MRSSLAVGLPGGLTVPLVPFDSGGCVADMSTALLHDPRCLAAVVARGIAYTQADKYERMQRAMTRRHSRVRDSTAWMQRRRIC